MWWVLYALSDPSVRKNLLELQTALFACSIHQRRGDATGRAGRIAIVVRTSNAIGQGSFLIEKILPSRVHHCHDLGQVVGSYANIDARGTGMAAAAAAAARILAIKDGGNVCGEAGVQDFFGIGDTG